MNMKKKLVTVCLVACMAVTAVAGGTLAYFTDKTEEKINTFTVGKVDITLTEEAWDAPEADHKIMPGKTLAKDPTVTVDGESEAAWVFVEVEIGDKFNSLMDNYSGTNGKDDHEQFAAWTDGTTKVGNIKISKKVNWFMHIQQKHWQQMKNKLCLTTSLFRT